MPCRAAPRRALRTRAGKGKGKRSAGTDGMTNAVVMGRRTWESLPERFRPLPGRLNVVLSRSAGKLALPDAVVQSDSLEGALRTLAEPAHAASVESVFVIGGGEVYREALAHPLCDAVHLTEVGGRDFDCDTFLPGPIDTDTFSLWRQSPPKRERGVGCTTSFLTYVRKPAPLAPTSASGANGENGAAKAPAPAVAPQPLPRSVLREHEEYQYLDLIKEIIEEGVERSDRTGTGTLSVFGRQMRFNLRRGQLPLLTTKRVFWRGVAEELLWFVKGSTNAKELSQRGVKIWDGNGSREFLDSRGLTEREEMDLGPVYGFQWRHFGAEYSDMHADYAGQGVDQLAEVVEKIKNNPTDRRIVLTAWNPAALAKMALPPCHMFAQFYVANGELSCQMYQRSCDMGLGVPFNIASYSLLTVMLAQVCGLKPGEFVHTLGDAHVYLNHVDPLLEQLQNEPRPFPTLRINPDVKDIDGFSMEDFTLEGYKPHKTIPMKMAV